MYINIRFYDDDGANILDEQSSSSLNDALEIHSRMYRKYIEGKWRSREVLVSLNDSQWVVDEYEATFQYSDTDNDFYSVEEYIKSLGKYLD